jgi:hypothetical protein
MVGHPDDRFTVETGCSAIYDVRREPNDRLGVRCICTPDPEETSAVLISPPRSCRSVLHTGTRWRSRVKGHAWAGGIQCN